MDEAIETLLVEDDPGDAELLGCLLAGVDGLDFRVDRAVRLADGLVRAAGHEYKLIFLDLTLPDSVGYQTYERMVAVAPDVPIIVMTGVDDATLAAAAIQKGVQDYIVKGSTTTSALDRSIRDACERKHLRRESQK